MERDRKLPSEQKKTDPENVKVIEWEDFEQELARFWSLSSALNEAKEKKRILQDKVEALIQSLIYLLGLNRLARELAGDNLPGQVHSESLGRLNEIEEMREKLEARKLMMEKMTMRSKLAKEDARKEEERLSAEVRSLLVAGTALSVARRKLQESNTLLYEEKGYIRLRNLQRMLRTRQQYMISEVSMIYPVKISAGPAQEQELEPFPSASQAGNGGDVRPVNDGSLTILGLHLSMLLFKKMSFFPDKKEVQRSAAALGYVAHAVSLISSYLQVPLRYPIRLGGSRSYIIDNAPSVEPTSSDSKSSTVSDNSMKHVEFPLFLEGQDTTRSAYAVFLLNKDLEQLLNYMGINSLGPRHILANLKELLRTIRCPDYIDTG